MLLGALVLGGCFSMNAGVAVARTVQDVVDVYGDAAQRRLVPRFEAAGVAYPPSEVVLIGLKEERVLELWAPHDGGWRQVHSYPVLAASGVAGPKLREGDRQVPEGVYRIIGLNPNSSYHLSLKLNYPNAFDRRHAAAEGRTEPGSDIFIHGRAVSIGCLAIGDPAIEELFVLTARIGRDKVKVLIAPHDARLRSLFPLATGLPAWAPELYREIEAELRQFRPAERTNSSP